MDPVSRIISLGAAAGGDSYYVLEIGDDGSANYGVGYGIDADSDGNTYIAGTIGADGYYAKILPSGNLDWDKEMVDGFCMNIYVGSDGIYMQGDSSGVCVFTKVSATDGSVTWQTGHTQSGTNWRRQGALDTSDNSMVACGFKAGSDFEGQLGDGLQVKCNSAGAIQWQRYLGSGAHDSRNGAAIDVASGAGSRTSAGDIMHWSSYNPHGYSYDRVQLQRSTSSGTQPGSEYSCGFNNSSVDTPRGCKVSSTDDINVCGEYAGGGTYLRQMSAQVWRQVNFEKKYNTSGSTFEGLIVDKSGAGSELDMIYAVGHTTNHGESWSEKAGLIVKYNNSGTIQWERALALSNTDIQFLRAAVVEDDLYLIGTKGTSTTSRIVVFKIPKDGSMTGTQGSYIYKSLSLGDSSVSTSLSHISITNGTYTPDSNGTITKTFQDIAPTYNKQAVT